MFTAALLIIAQNWEKPRYPSTGKQLSYYTPIPWNATQQLKIHYQYR